MTGPKTGSRSGGAEFLAAPYFSMTNEKSKRQSFQNLAAPYIAMGIEVFPLKPEAKEPALAGSWKELCTKDPAQIAKWDLDNPDYNLALVAKRDSICILEFDVRAGWKNCCEGHDIPATRIHKSGNGFAHVIFLNTPYSNALGNCSALLPDFCNDKSCEKADRVHKHEWFSFRSDWMYVVGPGSTHPNGNLYTVVSDVEPIPIPDWLVDWIREHKTETKKSTGNDYPRVADDFDFENFLAHYGIEIIAQDGPWHTTRVCPVAGYRHEHSLHTAFRYDGSHLGWKCFAQGCAGNSLTIGGVIRHLNREREPYPHLIWPEDDTEVDSEWLDAVSDGGEEIVMRETAPIPTKEKCYHKNCNCGLEHAETSLSPETRRMMDEALAEAETGEDEETEQRRPAVSSDEPLSFEELLVATMRDHRGTEPPVTVARYLDSEPAKIPDEAMYGKMKEWAERTELSMSIAYPAILAAYSAIPKHDEILGVRCNLYAALLMPVGGGKNLALDRATRVLHMTPGTDFQDCTLGGAGGLWQALGEKKEGRGKDAVTVPGPRKMLLNPAEFGATLVNTRIDCSTLSQHLCNLWDKNKITLPTREGVRPVDCRLSILGALPVDGENLEQFSRFFAEEASHGLYSRFIFVFSQERLDNRWAERWQMKSEQGSDQESHVPEMPATVAPIGWDPDAENFYSNIKLPDDHDSRGLYNLKRIALLAAAANGDKLVTPFCVQCAWFFMLWQAQLKRSLTVGIAQKVSGGELSDIIMKKLRAIDAKGSYDRSPLIDGVLNINLARVIHKCDWAGKYGSETLQRAVAALVKLGQLREGQKYNTKRKVVKSRFHFIVTKFEK
jgi:hypothetical protein